MIKSSEKWMSIVSVWDGFTNLKKDGDEPSIYKSIYTNIRASVFKAGVKNRKEYNMCDIKLVIHDENILYNPLDTTVISNDVAAFIKDRISEVHTSLDLGIISDEYIDVERLKRAIDKYVEVQKRKLDFELKWNNLRQLRLLLIGIGFIALWLFASSKTQGVWPEVLSIIGSFAVWEAANILVIDKPDIRIRKNLLALLGKAEIRYTCTKDDEHPA